MNQFRKAPVVIPWSFLLGLGVWILGPVGLTGCAPSDDSPEKARVSIEPVSPLPFYRFADERAENGAAPEFKVGAGSEEMNVLFAPYRTRAQKAVVQDLFRAKMDYANQIDVREDGTFPLSDLISRADLAPDAIGVAVSIRSEQNTWFEFFPLASTVSPEEFAALTVSTGAETESVESHTVEAYAREVLPLPREYRSDLIAIPENMRIEFSITIEDVLQTRQSLPVRFSLDVMGDGFDERIFEQEMTPPSEPVRDSEWSDHVIDLSSLAGRTGTFIFRTEYVTTPSEPETTSAVWGNPVLYTVEDAVGGPRPNVILISLDTLRADHIGSYGYERDTTPNLDAFAAQAVLFEQCIAPSSWTTPSHASLFTGWPPYIHEAGAHAGYRLETQFTTMAELAQAKGYLTSAFTEGGAVAGHMGFSQGFDHYGNGVSAISSEAGQVEKTFAEASEWLDDHGHLPFFMFLHTYEIHAPYEVKDPQWRKFTAPDDVAPVPRPPNIGLDSSDQLRDHYDNGIAYTDSVFGEFIRHLVGRDLLENTIVVVFSDHGEEFGEHDGMTHGVTLYDEVLHVPCIVRMPGASPPAGRVAEPIMLSDLFPTVMEMLEIDTIQPSGAITLRPAIERPGDFDAWKPRNRVAHIVQTAYPLVAMSLQDTDFKYIAANILALPDSTLNGFQRSETQWPVSPLERRFVDVLVNREGTFIQPPPVPYYSAESGATQEFLFDMNLDPHEQTNLAGQPAFQQLLERYRKALENQVVEKSDIAAAHGISAQAGVLQLTDEETARLKALGYLNIDP